MPKVGFRLVSLLTVASLLVVSFPKSVAIADINSCSASVDLNSVPASTNSLFNFTVNNTDTNTIRWVQVTRPSNNFTITGSQVNGQWGSSDTNEVATFTFGTIASGDNFDFGVIALTADVQAPPESWTVQVSDDPSGANPFGCSGALDTEISGAAPDTTPPTIYDISLSGLTSTSITISWTTDESATSRVYYGPDESYGLEKSNNSLKTNHAITLTNLSPDTGYHFQVESVDAAGNTNASEDNTFLTPVSGSSSNSSSDSSGTSNTSPLNPTVQKLKNPVEKIAPTIKLTSLLANPYQEPPTISGSAADNLAIFLIEYSVDGGKNWLLVDKASGVGGKKAKFKFKPVNLEDGNYPIISRATDTSGNTGISNKLTLVIDKLPPLVGGNVLSIGPQVLLPEQTGSIHTVVGIDQKITLSAIGGPTSINLVANKGKDAKDESIFSLTKSAETGLWSGIISFGTPGVYNLTAKSIDGAGNKLERDLNTFFVSKAPRVIEKKSRKPVTKAEVTLYYLEPESGTWVVWDGASYGQQNPQDTDAEGKFKLLVPSGTYYLKIAASQMRTAVSQIFDLDRSTAITSDIFLKEQFKLKIGPLNLYLPSLWQEAFNLQFSQNKDALEKKTSNLEGKSTPSFSLPSTEGGKVNSINLQGKPTVLSFITTWSPTAKEQLPTLVALQSNEDINIVPIATFESLAKVAVYTKIAGYKLNVLVDKEGRNIEFFDVKSLPTHYFVSRKGIIKKIITGPLSEKEIINNLGGL